jgi:hypothetical protein
MSSSIRILVFLIRGASPLELPYIRLRAKRYGETFMRQLLKGIDEVAGGGFRLSA